jgi:addiction module HigA family antidote
MKGADAVEDRRPTLPGEVLRDEVLRTCGITQDRLAEAMCVSRYTINQLVNGRRSVTPETALKLAKAVGTSPEFWLNLQRAVDLYEARVELGDRLDQVEELVKVPVEADFVGELPASPGSEVILET